MGVDPIVAGAEIVLALQTIVARKIDPTDQAVVSVTEFITDGLRNALPGNVILKGDTRSYFPGVQALIEERMAAVVAGVCTAHGATHEFEYTHEFEPTVNSPDHVAVAVAAAQGVAGADHVDGNCAPVLASEDFGAFLAKVPGNFMFIGAGVAGEKFGTPLHNPRYDFNDGILMPGARYFAALAYNRLRDGAMV
jgi:hippurate hydrolase